MIDRMRQPNGSGCVLPRNLLIVFLFALCFLSDSFALSGEDQQHLLSRLSFGDGAHNDLDFEGKSRAESVLLLLDTVDSTINIEPPGWLAFTLGPADKNLPLSKEALRKYRNSRSKIRRTHKKELQAWWLRQIHQGDSPVAERLLLFWHNYFATQIQPLPTAKMSWQQQLTLRRYLTGNYRQLLREMNKDPALLWYLDNHLNSKKKPNENYARELMELYSLGEGHFSEQDVKELARVMTGAGVDNKTWLYSFTPNRHDFGVKEFLGSRGNLKPDEVVDILLRQSRARGYLIERLWTEFVSPVIDNKAIEELSEVFEAADFELRPLLQALFSHSAFWAKDNRLTLYKSPVELVVSAHVQWEKPMKDYARVVEDLKAMGQELFEPPSVGGWPVGQDWVDSTRLAKRHQYLLGLNPVVAKQLDLDFQLK